MAGAARLKPHAMFVARRPMAHTDRMRPLRYSVNITLDGCCDHRVGVPDAELHRNAAETIAQADELIFGRVVYEMMESAWRPVVETGVRPDWMEAWAEPFARTIHAARKHVVSDTLDAADWNAEIVRGKNLEETVRRLKNQPGRGLLTGGVKLPLALAKLGLIDEYIFVVQPQIAGHGPTLLSGLTNVVDLKLAGRREFGSGAVELRYVPR
jgi:dihydrofolate reductase